MDFNEVKYLSWKTKVNSYVKYLVGEDNYNLDNIKQFYNNGFDDKIVALIISKSIIQKKSYNENTWWEDINRVFTIFNIKMDTNLRDNIIKKYYPKEPFNISCKILKNYGYLSLSLFVNDKQKKENTNYFII